MKRMLILGVVGLVIGFVAVQTGSLWPAIAFHFTHNSLALLLSRVPDRWFESGIMHAIAYRTNDGGALYHWPLALALGVAAGLLLWWFQRLPHPQYAEESLQESIERARSGARRTFA